MELENKKIERIIYLDITGALDKVSISWLEKFSSIADMCLKYEIVGRIIAEDDKAVLLTPMLSLSYSDPEVIPFVIPKGAIIKRERLCKQKSSRD